MLSLTLLNDVDEDGGVGFKICKDLKLTLQSQINPLSHRKLVVPLGK